MSRQIKEVAGRYLNQNTNPNQAYLNEKIQAEKCLDFAKFVLAKFGYEHVNSESDLHLASSTGELFLPDLTVAQKSPNNRKSAIFVDLYDSALRSPNFEYVDYTTHQNYLMHKYDGLLRFCFTNFEARKQFEIDVTIFLSRLMGTVDSTDIEAKLYGANREESHFDPTPPEFNFSLFFTETFGEHSLHALKPEASYFDIVGKRRFVDFILMTKNKEIAIELNGERYHHPRFISKTKYRSQLLKQNSLVTDNINVFRWSDRGMHDRPKFEEQMRLFFGSERDFQRTPQYKQQRRVSFEHYPHQLSAIDKIALSRSQGSAAFLVVLPTGTGKTEVFIEDLKGQLNTDLKINVLAILPTKSLQEQLIKRVKQAIPEIQILKELVQNDSSSNYISKISVVTSAYALRNYKVTPRNLYDYIVVDEAHHAAAVGLKSLLDYYQPSTLLGLTATPERADQQKLEKIFGEYEVDMTLEEAIREELVPPIRAFRLESNIDFSKVRFNGKEFVKSDLNKTVVIPSREQLIVDVLLKYFSSPLENTLKQGVIFCVDVSHTKRMAKLLNRQGIKAVAVDGTSRDGIKEYMEGDVQFICACDLLNEGWDAPQTSIVVMARPTMSKVLYTQQLGRGTRRFEGKEALYVIDVVDSYGASLISPWSAHSLFGLDTYQPFANLIEPNSKRHNELLILDGLYEGERRLEPINIFNFEKEFGELLNEEQLARELFVSTGTVREWIKKGHISPSKQLPFGRKTLNYFEPSIVSKIRQEKDLKTRTEETRKEDFFEFLEERDYTFSYKIVFLLMLIEHCNQRGEIEVETLVERYQEHYLTIYEKHGKVDKPKSPYNNISFLKDKKALQKNLLANPFEKFERKRFVYQSDELNIIGFDEVLWQQLTQEDLNKAAEQYKQDAKDYFEKFL